MVHKTPLTASRMQRALLPHQHSHRFPLRLCMDLEKPPGAASSCTWGVSSAQWACRALSIAPCCYRVLGLRARGVTTHSHWGTWTQGGHRDETSLPLPTGGDKDRG